jgi:glycosyltransferase involved in cell wall biosynthesis
MSTVVSVFGVEPRRIGGTETFARELSRQLGERGWQSVLCFLSEPTEEVERFLDLPNMRLEVLENSTNGNRETRRKLRHIIGEVRPQILHLHFVGFLNPYSWLARAGSVKQVFLTDHHSRPEGYVLQRAPFWKRVAARLINHPVTKVFCVSNYGYECMTALDLLPRRRFEMVYNGVDLTRVKSDPHRAINFRQRYSIPGERSIVTQVSWIIPEKGILDFLETARRVLRRNRNVHFVLVGEGAKRAEYMKNAEAMGIADHLTWTGMLEDPFGEGVFEAADIICQFSRWEEVFGWMIAEAMAHAKPIIATRVGGIPELVKDHESGFLVNRGDITSMSDSVLTLLGDAELRNRMGRAGRETVHERFDLRTNVDKLITSYQLERVGLSSRSLAVNRWQETTL